MQLDVETKKLISEVEQAMKDGQVEYQKATKLYAEKLVKYTNLVQEAVNKGTGKLPHVPQIPSFYRDSLQNNLDALLAHQGTIITLSDREYTNIKNGIDAMVNETYANFNSLAGGTLGY